jgi:hypothetical protein
MAKRPVNPKPSFSDGEGDGASSFFCGSLSFFSFFFYRKAFCLASLNL